MENYCLNKITSAAGSFFLFRFWFISKQYFFICWLNFDLNRQKKGRKKAKTFECSLLLLFTVLKVMNNKTLLYYTKLKLKNIKIFWNKCRTDACRFSRSPQSIRLFFKCCHMTWTCFSNQPTVLRFNIPVLN